MLVLATPGWQECKRLVEGQGKFQDMSQKLRFEIEEQSSAEPI